MKSHAVMEFSKTSAYCVPCESGLHFFDEEWELISCFLIRQVVISMLVAAIGCIVNLTGARLHASSTVKAKSCILITFQRLVFLQSSQIKYFSLIIDPLSSLLSWPKF